MNGTGSRSLQVGGPVGAGPERRRRGAGSHGVETTAVPPGTRAERPEPQVDGPRWTPARWGGLAYLVLALLAAGDGTMFTLAILAMSTPDAARGAGLQFGAWFSACLLVGVTGPVVFALTAAVPARLWRHPGWWAGLIGTTAAALVGLAVLILLVLFAATGATIMFHETLFSSATAVLLAALAAAGLGTRALVRAARRPRER